MRTDLRRTGAALLIAAWTAAAGCPAPETPAERSAAPPLGAWLPTESGAHRIAVRPEAPPAPVGRLHRWIVGLETADGRPLETTRITVGGGMPAHGHGFVTEPRVTRNLGGGEWLVEGMKFHMAGEWMLEFGFSSPAGADRATVRVQIDP